METYENNILLIEIELQLQSCRVQRCESMLYSAVLAPQRRFVCRNRKGPVTPKPVLYWLT